MRTSGNMRVVLNTKLWSDMICEKVVFYDLFPTNTDVQANEKNIRISALDEGEVRFKALTNWSKLVAGEDLPDCLQY